MSKCKRKQFPHFIDRVGVELEGGFARSRDMSGTFHQDISVIMRIEELDNIESLVTPIERPTTCTNAWECRCVECNDVEDEYNHDGVIVGEYVSNPLNTWQKYTKFVHDNYPDVVNDTCGMHVHASFNNFIYMSGMLECATEICDSLEKAYYSWGKAKLNRKEWLRMKGRLEGYNTYCRKGHNAICITGERGYPGYHPKEFVTEDRYHWLNFEALEKHGTIECRMLPAFDTAEHLIEATNILFNIYRRILHKYIKGSGVLQRSFITEDKLYETNSSSLIDITVNHEPMVGVTEALGVVYSSVLDVEQIESHYVRQQSNSHIGPYDVAQYPYKVKSTQTLKGLKKKVKTSSRTILEKAYDIEHMNNNFER